MSSPVRWLLLALPVALVAFVTVVLVMGGSARPYRVARVWGGPTDGRHVSLRVEAFEVVVDRASVQEIPISAGNVFVELRAPGFDARRGVALDAEGSAEVAFELPSPAPRLEVVVLQAEELVRAPIALGAERWAAAARRRGGWATFRAGVFAVKVAPARGVFAVPFEDPLWIEVSRGAAPAASVNLRAKGSGAVVNPELLTTDASGGAAFLVSAREHAASITLALEDDREQAELTFTLPIVPGAIRASSDGRLLTVSSPVPRDVAYFAYVTEHERLLGGRIPLRSDGSGIGASATVPIPPLDPAPEYVVVSSERDLRSPAAVGWPLALGAAGQEPRRTFDAVDALLADGRPRAAAREARRVARVRWVVAAFAAGTLALELLLLIAFTRSSDRTLDLHLEGAGMSPDDAERLAPKRAPRVVIALVVIALGFFLVAAMAVVMAR
jgi:hypothetical protein